MTSLYAADNEIQTIQFQIDSKGNLLNDVQVHEALGKAVDLMVQKRVKIIEDRFREQKNLELMEKDIDWMHDLVSLLSEQDQKDSAFLAGQYVEYKVEKKKFWGEFFPGSLNKAKDALKEQFKSDCRQIL